MPQRSLIRVMVITGGLLVFLQALFHSILGYTPVTSGAAMIPKDIAKLLFWAWFALGFALAVFGLLAIYASTALGQGKRNALVIVVSIGIATVIILIAPVLIGIGYPIVGIIGGLLLLLPAFWARMFN